MNWYLQSGKESDVALNSKISLARNINGYLFELENDEQIESLENKIKENLYNIGYDLKFMKLTDMDDVTVQSLVEKGIINSEFAKEKRNTGSILINDDENICIEINGENHLNIQVFASGIDLKSILQLAKEIDIKIGNLLDYSISKKYGYLTKYLNNLGTGLKASVKLHLPGLAKTRNVKKVAEVVSTFGINTKLESGDIYEISNQKTLGITEEEIVANIHVVAEKMIAQEREARKILEENSIELEDKVYRSYGILSNCRKINFRELSNLMSDIKLGTDLGILPELTDLKVMKIYLYTKSANLQKYCGKQLDKMQRDIKRAEVIKQIIKEG